MMSNRFSEVPPTCLVISDRLILDPEILDSLQPRRPSFPVNLQVDLVFLRFSLRNPLVVMFDFPSSALRQFDL